MNTAVLTGATGFLGYHLLNELVEQGVFVHALCRPGSNRLSRLTSLNNINIIELDMDNISCLKELLPHTCDIFYHLAWQGERNNFFTQVPNIKQTMDALQAAHALGCRRFVCTGSQAEYGIHHGLITENTLPAPVNPYGAAKLAACNLSRVFAGQLGIEWIWARLFSVYGPGDNPNSLIPYLLLSLTNGQIPILSQCCHKWDYLYASDAAKALRLLGSISQINSIYNIASGDNRSLRYYAEKLRDIVAPGAILGYGLSNIMAVPLEASIDKIREDTGWEAAVGFDDGIRNTFNHFKITV